jgi:hypothetical protein
MATVFTDVAAVEENPTPETYLDVSLSRGKTRCVQAVYEANGAASGTVINVCRLYKGERVLLGGALVLHDALGSGVTLKLGDDDGTGADDDRYLEAASAATAGAVHLGGSVACINKVPHEVGADCWLTCTVGGGAATGTVRFEAHLSANN